MVNTTLVIGFNTSLIKWSLLKLHTHDFHILTPELVTASFSIKQ